MKIFILNHCSHNKGDNSVLYYLTQCLDIVQDNTEIIVSCSDGVAPFWAKKEIDAVSWPGGKIFKAPGVGFVKNLLRRANFMVMRKVFYKVFLYFYADEHDGLARAFAVTFFSSKLIKAFKDADKVICTGGHHLSNVLEKDCINPLLVSMALADLYGHQPVMWSQSIGPIDTAALYSKKAMGRIFNACSQIFVRDDLSATCVTSTSSANTVKAPDSVFLSNKLVKDFIVTAESPYVCCAVYTAGITDEKYLAAYKESWVRVSREIIDKGFNVVFIPMQYKGFGGDERAFLNAIVNQVKGNHVRFVDQDKSPQDTLALFKGASFIIGHKTHSVIYGLSLEIPTIAIAYHDKTRYFMSIFGLEGYVHQDIVGCEAKIISQISAETVNAQRQIHSQSDKSALFAEELIQNMKTALYD